MRASGHGTRGTKSIASITRRPNLPVALSAAGAMETVCGIIFSARRHIPG